MSDYLQVNPQFTLKDVPLVLEGIGSQFVAVREDVAAALSEIGLR